MASKQELINTIKGWVKLDNEIRSLKKEQNTSCLLYTSPSPRDRQKSRMPSSA